MNSERVVWIDQLRGLAMIAILFFHTEIYYCNSDIIPYGWFVANALCIFYFLSGYLFYNNNEFLIQHKLNSILRGLILPYFLFTLILAFPKAYMNNIPVIDNFIKILLGNGSWFVSSLIVAEIIFCLILYSKKQWVLYLTPIIALITAYLLTDTNISMHHNYWNFHNAMIGLVFLYLGYIFHRYEKLFQLINHPIIIIIFLIILIILKYIEKQWNIILVIDPVIINNYFLFLIDMVLSILIMVGLTKSLSIIKPIKWTGKWSLYYYFICGAVPMAITKILELFMPYKGDFLNLVIASGLTWGLASVIVYCIVLVKRKI